jgi:hypothetical protein
VVKPPAYRRRPRRASRPAPAPTPSPASRLRAGWRGPPGRGRRRRHPAADPQRRDPDPAQREQRGDGRRGRHGHEHGQVAEGGGRDLVIEVSRAGDSGVGQHGAQCQEHPDAGQGADQRAHHGVDRGDDPDLPGGGPDQPERGVALLAAGGGQLGGGADQDEDREHERDRADHERVAEVTRPYLAPRGGRDLVHHLGGGQADQLRRRVADVDHELVGPGQRLLADRAGQLAGEAVAELVRGRAADQRGLGRRCVVLPCGRQPGDPGRHRGAGAESGDIEPFDGLPTVDVVAVVPQLGARSRCVAGGDRLAGGGLPRRPVAGDPEGVEVGEHGQHDRYAGRDRGGGDQQADQRLPATAQREAQAKSVHYRLTSTWMSARLITFPSRTITSRSA